MKVFYLLVLSFLFSFNTVQAQETWQEATHIADSLSMEFEHKKSLNFRLKALEIANKKQSDTLGYLTALKNITETEMLFNDRETRKKTYKELVLNVKELENYNPKPEQIYQVYRRVSISAYDYLRDMEEADKYVKKSIDAHLNSDQIDSILLLKNLHSRGMVLREKGDLNKALKIFDEGIKFFESQKKRDSNTLATIYFDMAYTYHPNFLNIPKKRYEYLKKAESVFRTLKNPNQDNYQTTLSQLSDYERFYGNYEVSLGYLNKGYQLYLDNKDSSQTLKSTIFNLRKELDYYHYKIMLYAKLEQEKELLESIKKIESFAINTNLDPLEYEYYVLSYLKTGRYYKKTENYKQAMFYFNKGLKTADNATETDYHPDFYVEIVELKLNQNKIKEAKILLDNDSLFIGMVPSVKSHYLKNKLRVAVELRDFDTAKEYINNTLYSISDKSSLIDIDNLNIVDYKPGHLLIDITILRDLAFLLEANETPWDNVPEKLYKMALIHFDANFIQGELNPGAKRYLDMITNGYLKYQENDDQESLLYFLEKYESITSRYLYSKFNQSRYVKQDEQTNKLLEQEKQLRSNITYLKRKQARNDTDEVAQQLFELQSSLDEVEITLSSQNKQIESVLEKQFLFKNLDTENKNYVKFIEAKNNLYRFLIDDTGIHFKKLGNYDEIAKDVIQFITSIKNPSNKEGYSSKIENKLFVDLLADIPFKEKTYIVPDKVLNYLPFELLQKNNVSLIETNTISYAIGLSYLQSETSSKRTTNNVALFAPSYSRFVPTETQLVVRGEAYDLSGAKAEVAEISKIIPSTVYIDDAASKKAFQNLSNNVSVIHLSMHSFLNDKDPELSSLVFSDNEVENELYISELYGLNLNANLAVLSACNTGVGGYDNGDGVVSMSRAFKYAGVPATVSSLWSAPDLSTKKIMVSFYEHLKNGASKSKALQLAKLDYLKNTNERELKHPYYWAGFVLHGDDSPILLENEFYKTLWFWVVIAILLLIIVLILRKRTKNQLS
ncbi:hypothetical protein ULMS_07000 [Patiriisocius marinistellae]|uniref:CHAT domain-containing protein n=1 Tax=Patiriisocius marinistellae TaxID=2494560 RepID=A0A5J4FVQ7_9FLAO|nr:CHAT domain-containing protein [Patiriisocius marinistellae]GEQ85192.1 hypothetical protein ULMS_07000 [Patiriisocius marinistellae]